MNIMILSSGSRVKLVEYFKKEFNLRGFKVYTADCSELAPTLYVSDGFFIVPKITDENYLQEIISICKKHNIGAVLSLIDPELSLLAKNINLFNLNEIIPIISNYSDVELCFDKFRMSEYLVLNNINTPNTYKNKDLLYSDLQKKEIDYPLFCKPVKGSASLDMKIINNDKELKLFEMKDMYIIQEFINGREYGVDVYIDFISGEIIDLFIKEKLTMRAGETDKSVSVFSPEIKKLVENVVSVLDLRGPIDIDIFEYNGKLMVSEINPRFGGGYLHAHESGHNFINYIYQNLQYKKNTKIEKEYIPTLMMKYSEVITINKRIDE